MLRSVKLRNYNRVLYNASKRYATNFIVLGDEEKIKDITATDTNKVFYFTASWCPPCKAIGPKFESMSKEFASISFVKIDVDEFPELSADYGIRSVPTFVFLSGNKKISEFSGANELTLRDSLENLNKEDN